MAVVPAQAGTQEPQAEGVGEVAWIPACAGMTLPQLSISTFWTDY